MSAEKNNSETGELQPVDAGLTNINELRFSKKDDVHDRRLKVMRLRYVQSFRADQIMQMLGIDERTVYRDLAAIRKIHREANPQKGKQDTVDVVGKVQAGYEERQRQRWTEYHDSKDPSHKRKLLKDIQEEEVDHIKVMQSLGAIEKAAEQVETLVTQETWKQKLARLKREREEAKGAGTK